MLVVGCSWKRRTPPQSRSGLTLCFDFCLNPLVWKFEEKLPDQGQKIYSKFYLNALLNVIETFSLDFLCLFLLDPLAFYPLLENRRVSEERNHFLSDINTDNLHQQLLPSNWNVKFENEADVIVLADVMVLANVMLLADVMILVVIGHYHIPLWRWPMC